MPKLETGIFLGAFESALKNKSFRATAIGEKYHA